MITTHCPTHTLLLTLHSPVTPAVTPPAMIGVPSDLDVTGTGVLPTKAATTGAWGVEATATGVLPATAAATGLWGVEVTATGVLPATAAATGIWGLEVSGTGVLPARAAATRLWTESGALPSGAATTTTQS